MLPDLKAHLTHASTIAVIGCSAHPYRTSHGIARYLMNAGYEVIPVNPNYEHVLGQVCYPDLQHLPDDLHLDIVNVFRAAAYTADAVQDTITWAEAHGARPLIWTQIGVSSRQAETLAQQAGLPYVAERCIMVEHRRLVG